MNVLENTFKSEVLRPHRIDSLLKPVKNIRKFFTNLFRKNDVKMLNAPAETNPSVINNSDNIRKSFLDKYKVKEAPLLTHDSNIENNKTKENDIER